MMDAILRKKPGVLGHASSADEDSFAKGSYLEAPQFTRPQDYKGLLVPEVLLSGDHKKISDYREKMELLMTLQKRPELLSDGEALNWSELNQFLQSRSIEEIKACGLDFEKLQGDLAKRLL